MIGQISTMGYPHEGVYTPEKPGTAVFDGSIPATGDAFYKHGLLLLRGDSGELLKHLTRVRKREKKGGRIRCPKCRWEPRKSDLWRCLCSFVWNTFDTHGVCPSCGKAWEQTQCLRCQQWSPHESWYENDFENPS